MPEPLLEEVLAIAVGAVGNHVASAWAGGSASD
jgi:hypothetical protein